MSVEIFKKCKIFQKHFHTEGRRQYDHHTKLNNIQQSFNLWTEKFPEDNPLKPTDLKCINYGIVQLENFMEKAQKLRNSSSVEQDNASSKQIQIQILNKFVTSN